MYTITTIAKLTRDELRESAVNAANNNEPIHEACPVGLSAEQRNEFESAYVEHRHELLARRPLVEGWREHGFRHLLACP
jgi:hypothetical protein